MTGIKKLASAKSIDLQKIKLLSKQLKVILIKISIINIYFLYIQIKIKSNKF